MKKAKIIILDILLSITVIALIVLVMFNLRDYEEYRTVKRDAAKLSTDVQDKKTGKNFTKLQKINPDITAWIKIPGTSIDYPVVRTKDNSYYLSHNIYKKENKYGTLFVDNRIRHPFAETLQNCIVYGHNMGRSATVMFSELKKYEDESFYKKHNRIKIFTVHQPEGAEYKILAVRQVRASSDTFNTEFAIQEDFDSWLQKQRAGSLYQCEQLPDNINSTVTLSTCTNDGKNRFVLICGTNSSQTMSAKTQ